MIRATVTAAGRKSGKATDKRQKETPHSGITIVQSAKQSIKTDDLTSSVYRDLSKPVSAIPEKPSADDSKIQAQEVLVSEAVTRSIVLKNAPNQSREQVEPELNLDSQPKSHDQMQPQAAVRVKRDLTNEDHTLGVQ